MNSSGWPASFASGLHAALVRRIPPDRNGPELEQLSLALIEALEQGNLTVPLSPEREQLVRQSGWLEGEASPLVLQGQRLGLASLDAGDGQRGGSAGGTRDAERSTIS